MTLKPSQASRHQPFLHLVGDRRRRADDGEAAIAAEPLRELAHGQVLAPGQRDDALPAALAGVGLRESPAAARRDRSLEASCAERDRQRGDARCRNARGCRAGRASRCASSSVSPTTTKHAGQDLQVVAVAAELRPCGPSRRHRTPARRRALPPAANTDLGGLGGELAAGLRRAGLHDHRPALDRPGDVERAAHREILALVVEHMQLRRIENRARLSTSRTKASSAQVSHSPVTTS